MAFALTHEDEWLRVVYSGVITVNERAQALSAAFAALPRTGRRRILVDFRDVSATPPAQDFDITKRFVDMLARETQGGSARIAYVTESDLPIDRCVEMLIESRRVPAKRFTDESLAIAWLQES